MSQDTTVSAARMVAHLGHSDVATVTRGDVVDSVDPDVRCDMVAFEPTGLLCSTDVRELEDMGWRVNGVGEELAFVKNDA